MNMSKRLIINIKGVKSLIKGIGNETTVLKNAARHRTPKACGALAPLTFLVIKLVPRTPIIGNISIIDEK